MTKNKAINKIFNSIIFAIIIGIFIFGKIILFYSKTVSINARIGTDTIIGTIWFMVVIVGILAILPNRTRIVTTIIIDILISIILFGDNTYYTYSNNVLSVAQITNLQYGEEILSTLPMVIKGYQIIYFLDIIIIMILIFTKILKLEKKEKINKKQLVAKIAVGIISISIFCFVDMKYIEKANDKVYDKGVQIKESTIFGYHISDINNVFNSLKNTTYKNYDEMIKDYEELKQIYDEKYGKEKYSLKGILEGRNILIIQLESMQEFVINKQINGKQITPNLNKFLQENIEISNMHMQSYSSTADSEHSTVTSIYPMENGMSYSKYFSNTYDDIFKIFKQKEYHTSYMHGNYGYFWNRQNVYRLLNLDDLVFKDKMEDISENISGYLSDELLYKQAVQKLKKYKQPFISYVVAASSHTPFTLEGLQDRSKINIDVGKYKDTFFGNYLEAANYADYAFGILIQELKDAGLYEDMSILVFGDHNGLTMYDEELIDFLGYTDTNVTDVDLKLNYTRVLCGFKIPGIQNIKIEKPVNKLDIKPTFAYLCNLKDTFSLGTNIFGSKDFVSLNNERIITSRYYYEGEWYNNITGEKLNLENIDKETKQLLEEYYQYMKTELNISNSISIHNLLKIK